MCTLSIPQMDYWSSLSSQDGCSYKINVYFAGEESPVKGDTATGQSVRTPQGYFYKKDRPLGDQAGGSCLS